MFGQLYFSLFFSIAPFHPHQFWNDGIFFSRGIMSLKYVFDFNL